MVSSMDSINLGKYNIFHTPEKFRLFVMVKASLHYTNFLSMRALKDYGVFQLFVKDPMPPFSTG